MPSRLVAGPIVGQTDSFGATWGNPALLPRLSVQPRPRLNWVPLPQHQAQQQVAGHYQQYQLTPTLTLILTLTLTLTQTLTLTLTLTLTFTLYHQAPTTPSPVSDRSSAARSSARL